MFSYKPKVLVIDDDYEIAHLVEMTLTTVGYKVEVARDGRRGLAAALADPPDLILLDYRMPGKDGFDLLRDLRATEEFKNTPVIMITGSGGPDVVGLAIQHHVSDFIVKPFDLRLLVERAQKVCPTENQLL